MSVKLMDLENFSRFAKEVSSTEIYLSKGPSGGTYHPDGLFSEEIFGPVGTPNRKKNFGYINLNTKVVHPALLPILRRMERKFVNAIMREERYTIDAEGNLQKDDKGEIFGIRSMLENFDRIKFRGGSDQRDNLVFMLNHYRKNGRFFIDKYPVIPPAYRDIIIYSDGTENMDPLNDYYIKIIRTGVQLKLARGLIFDVLSSGMQDLVWNLYEFVSKKISKKEGILRHDMLGKRVDFSARAVIAGGGTELKGNEIGVPLRLLVKLFEPFVLYELLNGTFIPKEKLAEELENAKEYLKGYKIQQLSVSSLRTLLAGINKGDEIPDSLMQLIEIAVNRAIEDKVVIAKRDPALHTESSIAFKPKLIPGKVIRLNTMYCDAFGADFDGDQMALFTPMTKESIEEAKEKMMTPYSKDGMKHIALGFSKDIVAGIYGLTKEPKQKTITYKRLKSEDELDKLEIYDGVIYDGIKTTVGRIYFNRELPSKYPFVNEEVNKKKLLNEIISNLYDKYSKEEFRETCNNLQNLGFKWFTYLGSSFSIEDLEIPASLYKLKEKLETANSVEAQKILDQMEKELADYLEKTGKGIGLLTSAGATKGMGQLRQILVAKGLIADIDGNVQPPISNSYSDGTTSREFFDMSPGNRKGIVDRCINTASTGYMSRQLVYALQSIEANSKIRDCGTKRYLEITATPDISKRLVGRNVIEEGKIVPYDKKKHEGTVIKLRSPIFCRSRKMCLTCYGQLLLRNGSPYVGITAATVAGERFTQLGMKSFHTGGAVSVKDVDLIDSVSKSFEPKKQKLYKELFIQEGTSLVCKKDGFLIINREEFGEPQKEVIIEEDKISLSYGFFYLDVGGVIFEIMYDDEVSVPLLHGYEEEGNEIVVPFKQNEKFLVAKPPSDIHKKRVTVISAILSGRKAWKNPTHFFLKVFGQWQEDSNADLVHFEVLVSNLLRSKKNPRLPARLDPSGFDAIVVNIKTIPQLESWLSSLAFENFNKSIETALVYDRPPDESILERVITGNL